MAWCKEVLLLLQARMHNNNMKRKKKKVGLEEVSDILIIY